ncbi:sigma-54 interaction domain-containing protein [Brevibacillus borstelensis]|uniref:sigma-54 interaction domain-containing protein n=1 Tax=Brevibacillus borstelensis TaxID=45462 RepID=UPI0030C1C18E
MVTRLEKEEAAGFSEAQLRTLSRSFTSDAIQHLKQSIAAHLPELDDYQVIELFCSSHRFLVWKDIRHVVIALTEGHDHRNPQSDTSPGHSVDNEYFIAQSAAMKQVMNIIQKVSYVDSTVLLLGKSGVGKGAIARLIHTSSRRKSETFLSINCGAIPESLMEAELFGYEAGSFTGGNKNGRKGLFEAAHNGTIFLDEIGELPYALQVKLLEVLQEKQIRRVGGTENIPVNVRIIAATNQDLSRLVASKKFREDLYYRLHVVPIEIPALKERSDDISLLLHYFLRKYTTQYKKSKTIHPEVLQAFVQYEWPGNVRELENMIERLVITTEDQEIQLHDLPASVRSCQSTSLLPVLDSQTGLLSLKQAKKQLEKEMILKAYQLYKSSYKAAEALGVDQSTIAKKLKEYRKNGW